jgi:hypothetical protein
LSLAALLLVVVFALVTIPSLLVAAFGPAPRDQAVAQRLVAATNRNSHHMQQLPDVFNGRSAFFPPPALHPPRNIQIIDSGKTGDIKPEVPPCPDRYTGPTMIGFVGDEVWFKPRTAREQVLRIPIGHADADLTVLSMNMPWDARVNLNGCTYDLSLWNRNYAGHLMAQRFAPAGGLEFDRPVKGLSP